MIKKIVKYLLLVSLFSVLAYTSLIWLINTNWLQERLNSVLPLKANWSDLRINFFNGRVAIENLVVDTKHAGRLGTIRYLAADLDLSALLEKKIKIDSVKIVGITSDVSMAKINDLRPAKKVKKAPKPLLDLEINNISILSLNGGFTQSDTLFYRLKSSQLYGSLNLRQKKYQLTLLDNFTTVHLPKREFKSVLPQLNALLVDKNIKLKPFSITGFGYRIIGDSSEFDFSKTLTLATGLTGTIYPERLLGLNKLPGRNDFRITTKGEMNNPDLTLLIMRSKDQIGGVRFDSLNLSAVLQNRQMQVKAQIEQQQRVIGSLNLKLDAAEAFPNGLLNKNRRFSQLAYDLTADLKDPRHLSVLPLYLKQSVKNGHLTLKGSGIKPDSLTADLALKANVGELKIRDFVLRNCQLQLNLAARQGGIYRLQSDLLQNGKKLTLSAAYQRRQKSGTLDLTTDIAAADSLIIFKKSNLALQGRIRGGFNLKNQPTAELNTHLQNLSWRNYRLDSLNLAAAVDDKGRLLIDHLILNLDSSSFKVQGTSQLFTANKKIVKQPYFDLQFAANRFQLNPWLKDVELVVNGTGDIRGSRLKNLEGNLTLAANNGKVWQQPIDSLKIKMAATSKIISLEDLTLKFPGGNIIGSAEIQDFNSYTAKLKIDSFNLKSLPLLAQKRLSGALSLDLYGKGFLSNPQFTAQLKIEKPIFQDKFLDPVKLDFILADQQLKLAGDAGFTISGSTDLMQKSYQLDLNFADWNFARWLPDSTKSFSGLLNGKIHAAGKLAPFSLVTLTTDLDSIYLKREERLLFAGQGIKLFYDQSGWRIPENRLQIFQNGYLVAKGNGEIGKQSSFDLDLLLPAIELNAWLPDLDGLQGSLSAKSSIDLEDSTVLYTGEIDLKQIGVQLPYTDQLLKGLNGKIRFDRNKVMLDSLQGMIENGSFRLGGSMELNKFKPEAFNLNLTASTLPVTLPEYFDGHLNGSLNYHGNLDKSQLAGTLDVLDFNYYRDIEIINRLLSFRSGKSVKPAAKPWFGDKVGLNVTLNSRKPLVIDNNLLYLSLQPDINVKGTLSHPELQGRATIKPGSTVEVINNQFVIKKGVLDFSPYLGYLPDLNLDCQTTTDKYKINVTASGNLAEPQISLTSTPPEQESDLISILLTGRKPAELSASSDYKTNKEKVALDWLFNKFKREINTTTGLDYLDLKLEDNFSTRSGSGYGITVGKKLSDRLLIKYSVSNSNRLFVQTGALEYQLLESFFFDGYQSTDGVFGGELQFRNEFR